ncbi:MAG: zinc ribbon domain-containing protein [Chloroflexi bacterium]|nr:zinc ribbon domain-containing protein [Chloroflexota bacterium]
MPIYEYYCQTCQSRFELLRPMSKANAEATCPQGHNNAERVLSVFASFTTNDQGVPVPVSGTASGACSTCGGGSCSTCGA